MAFFSSMNIVGSGMTAQQARLDVISENITNMNTTRTESGGAYRRKITVMQSETGKNGFREALDRTDGKLRDPLRETRFRAADGSLWEKRIYADGSKNTFREALSRASRKGHTVSNRDFEQIGGVKIVEIAEDETELPMVYDPTHPDANEEGYLELPNVTLVKEVTDAMAASQAFSANVTAFNALKQVVQRGLDIGV